ncbi:MAG TPA: (Fe-S)-binding protein, partial [Stellaceae bacterium]|nr:(Fe-S)-binding protein [Stellaceae bacterium]
MTHIAPIAPLIPETAPFSATQRAWLNGWLAAYYGATASSGAAPLVETTVAAPPPPAPTEDDHPWHDMAMPLEERMTLAKGRPLPQRLMAAMAQQDCGQCGYLCKTYAEAIASGGEKALNRCVPGGKETQRKLKELLAAMESQRTGAPVAPAAKSAAAVGTRDRPALAILVDAHPLNRPGSG